MKLRKTGLWLLAALAIMVLCMAGFAYAESPMDPHREAVLRQERIANQLLNGPVRNGSFSWDTSIVRLEAQADPTLNGTGSWNIYCNGEVREMSISLMMQDYSEEYTTVYSQYYERKVSSYTTCEIVTEGNYILTVLVTLTDGRKYFDNDQFIVGDTGAPVSLMDRVDEIVAGANGTPWEKALYLHDWLTANAYYDGNYEYYGADGVLLRGYGVCDSYSKAYLLLCEAAGIPVSRVTGWAGESHAWNAIQIHDEWYYVDVTWDDPYIEDSTAEFSGLENHDYFCLNDDLMNLDHTKDTEGDGAFDKTCTSLTANYAVRMSPDIWSSWETWNELGNNILTGNSVEQYSGRIQAELEDPDGSFAIPCEDNCYVITEWKGSNVLYGFYEADSASATRKWTLLAAVMSQASFEDQAVSVIYDRANQQFIVEPGARKPRFLLNVIDVTNPENMIPGQGGTISGSYSTESGQTCRIDNCPGGYSIPVTGLMQVQVNAVPKKNYTFIGWYHGETANLQEHAMTPGELLSTEPNYEFEIAEDGEPDNICAVFVRSDIFSQAAFRIPSSVKTIEAHTFEGIDAKTVYVPDTCTKIGEGAFRNCKNLLAIRLPENCDIDDTAFDDCGTVIMIYEPAGGGTQE